ncbi:phenylacetaldoxime dehydratase [Caballeronia peredens]|nr:phenylacetaldoxime dehydratase family protein [Caballeronia zhejiangensis]SAL77714.1 phenylacetaldoxime dehydratase [Caballeronia peredens]
MRDRLPISAIDELNSPYGDNVPVGNFRDSARKRVRVDVPPNVVSIRSGQFWAQAKGEQFDDYYENMRPKLETGMSYLSEHPEETGCLSMRHITHLNEKGDELRETCKHVYILSLKHLEDWTESHKSHLDIWKHALAMRRKYGAERDFVSWHEVFVIGTTPSFEYVNCHAGTGLLRFADIWGTF